MYTDEYFQIEQMNNQLINSQRALMKSNKKLQSLLAEIRQASNAIAILEQDDLTALYSASAFTAGSRNVSRNIRIRFMISLHLISNVLNW